ncbi:hypothetical protein GCM10010145_00120 [Streptomyces ruber]|uniref:HTH cro/C1-type domain-containing protein n=2 Tax=Streptomyces TaxID=1883 RepID=A0A918B8G0_9ACTN|nr:hypothetical protein GCM10010145_00120 [Streptomyces ruber]
MGEKVDDGLAGLGRALRYLREKAGKSLGQLAQETSYDKSYLSRLESGQRLAKMSVMEELDRFYGSGDLLVQLWKVARHDAYKDQYKQYMRLEAEARIVHVFTLGFPGLLQTEDVAREALSGAQATGETDEAVDEQVAARMGRQLILHRNSAPTARFIIDESAFRRRFPTAKTWEEQLLHIEAAGLCPNVTVQVLPFAA